MDFHKMMRQAQAMQNKMQEAQKRIEALELEGISGGGMVTVMISGNGRVKSISINPAVVSEEVDVLEDLVVAAMNDAWEKLEQKRNQEMSSSMAGTPGLPFSFG